MNQYKVKYYTRKIKEYPFISIALVVINAAIFLWGDLKGINLWPKGAVQIYSVLEDKEYYRIFTAMFLHLDAQHLFNNMLSLLVLGTLLEKNMSHLIYLGLYLLSGIGGNLISLYWYYRQGSPNYSAGASGAVFGLDGILLAMVIAQVRGMAIDPTRVIIAIAISLYAGFSKGNVNNSAHIGGLIVGFVLAYIYCMIRNKRESRRRPPSGYWGTRI